MVFGVWWFLNTESQIMDITVKRLELLGTSFIPQHSDSRILEQLLYKWPRARKMLQDLLTEKYLLLEELGWKVTDQEIERDVRNLLSWNFLKYTERDIYWHTFHPKVLGIPSFTSLSSSFLKVDPSGLSVFFLPRVEFNCMANIIGKSLVTRPPLRISISILGIQKPLPLI